MTDRARPGEGRDDFDVVCLSHLRWDFAYQRPQHLMSRWGRRHRVLFVEEPGFHDGPAELRVSQRENRVSVAVPMLPHGTHGPAAEAAQRDLLCGVLRERRFDRYVLWMYTAMALPMIEGLSPIATVYDCMDELALFNDAPAEIRSREQALMERADVVFTGGRSLYRAKRASHPRVHPFPSSVDHAHFVRARGRLADPPDQAGIAHPRLGYHGVIDERIDVELIDAVASRRPEWQLVLVGPVVKRPPASLPIRPNIHYIGSRPYSRLPSYLSGWNVAVMPFAENDATRFISPTKTLEYLAGGTPTVSTPIADVVEPYGERGLVRIARGPDAFVAAADEALAAGPTPEWIDRVDRVLATTSWDATFAEMRRLVLGAIGRAAGRRDAARPRPISRFDALVVGAGFAGAVVAQRLAEAGHRILVVDRRPHIAGNAFDHYDDAGILVHRYGPHIFHTNSATVFDYLSRFTEWRAYEHRVLADVRDRLLPMPINLDTINGLYGLHLDADGMRDFLLARAETVGRPRTSEDVVVGAVGRELYELFFHGYTRKQWGLDPSQLDASVTARVPTRLSRDDRYFTDRFQAMPKHGYTRLFENLLDGPAIKLMLNTDYAEIGGLHVPRHTFYTGPVDEFFDFRYGELPYRSIDFAFTTHDREHVQPVAVINHPNRHRYTRVTEFKHLTGQSHPRTTVVHEFPCDHGDPYYPVPRPENRALYACYARLATAARNVTFLGRLGTYRYYNMDQVVAQALKVAGTFLGDAADAPQVGTALARG